MTHTHTRVCVRRQLRRRMHFNPRLLREEEDVSSTCVYITHLLRDEVTRKDYEKIVRELTRPAHTSRHTCIHTHSRQTCPNNHRYQHRRAPCATLTKKGMGERKERRKQTPTHVHACVSTHRKENTQSAQKKRVRSAKCPILST